MSGSPSFLPLPSVSPLRPPPSCPACSRPPPSAPTEAPTLLQSLRAPALSTQALADPLRLCPPSLPGPFLPARQAQPSGRLRTDRQKSLCAGMRQGAQAPRSLSANTALGNKRRSGGLFSDRTQPSALPLPVLTAVTRCTLSSMNSAKLPPPEGRGVLLRPGLLSSLVATVVADC